SSKALITVLGIPQKPQIFGHEQPIDEEKVARLLCRSSGSKPAAQLRWRKGNRELKDKPTAKIEPHPQYPREGEKLQLQCDGQGNPMSSPRVPHVPQLPTPHVHSTPAPPPGPSQPISHASMASAPSFTPALIQDASPVPSTSSTYHAMIGGVVAVIVFLLLSLLIVLGHYLIRHKGTYLTHEAKGSDDAPDADTAIINAEGGQAGGDDKKEYFI
ncbi:PREDICTED: cell adhesion molecule 3, partial [Sturnus vulgaris]|uniref:cell adhesion molecule 3 n=1 Tax=Sturnus vulgaris TaxID=9172 RepID=UPI00071A2F61